MKLRLMVGDRWTGGWRAAVQCWKWAKVKLKNGLKTSVYFTGNVWTGFLTWNVQLPLTFLILFSCPCLEASQHVKHRDPNWVGWSQIPSTTQTLIC